MVGSLLVPPILYFIFLFNPLLENPSFKPSLIKKNPFENIVGKGENAYNQHFFHLPTMFSPLLRKKLHHLTHSHTMTPFDAPGKQAV